MRLPICSLSSFCKVRACLSALRESFSKIFFSQAWGGPQECLKMNFFKNLFSWLKNLQLCVIFSFYNLGASFPLSKWEFGHIYFLVLPWGGVGVNFSMKKEFLQNIWFICRSTQFLMLIRNMILVLMKSPFFKQNRLTKQAKKAEIYVSGQYFLAFFSICWNF